MKWLLLLSCLIPFIPPCVTAQFTLKQSEGAFRQNNLLLLAKQYNINATQAAVIQARIWELPYLSVEFNALNPQQQRAFDVGGRGQKILAIRQLIYTGDKKKNEVAFAKSNVGLAEMQFEQLVRTLRFQLRERYYSLYSNFFLGGRIGSRRCGGIS